MVAARDSLPYTYVNGNPVNAWDPSGHREEGMTVKQYHQHVQGKKIDWSETDHKEERIYRAEKRARAGRSWNDVEAYRDALREGPGVWRFIDKLAGSSEEPDLLLDGLLEYGSLLRDYERVCECVVQPFEEEFGWKVVGFFSVKGYLDAVDAAMAGEDVAALKATAIELAGEALGMGAKELGERWGQPGKHTRFTPWGIVSNGLARNTARLFGIPVTMGATAADMGHEMLAGQYCDRHPVTCFEQWVKPRFDSWITEYEAGQTPSSSPITPRSTQ